MQCEDISGKKCVILITRNSLWIFSIISRTMRTLCMITLLNFPYMDKIHITIILPFLDHSLSNSRVTWWHDFTEHPRSSLPVRIPVYASVSRSNRDVWTLNAETRFCNDRNALSMRRLAVRDARYWLESEMGNAFSERRAVHRTKTRHVPFRCNYRRNTMECMEVCARTRLLAIRGKLWTIRDKPSPKMVCRRDVDPRWNITTTGTEQTWSSICQIDIVGESASSLRRPRLLAFDNQLFRYAAYRARRREKFPDHWLRSFLWFFVIVDNVHHEY